ncbi:MAG: glycoside hydrolase family 15 protein [Pseudomonadota bacterium]
MISGKGSVRAALALMPALVFVTAANAHADAEPHASWGKLPVSNGFSPAVYDIDANRINTFFDHIYSDYDGATPSTDLCWDTYWGLNVGGSSAWLGEREESSVEFEDATGIIRVERSFEGLSVDEFYFSPFSFNGPILVMVASVTNTGAGPVAASLYSLHNFHAGTGAPEAGFTSESIQWQDGQYVETAAATGHTFFYRPLDLPSHRRTDAASGAGNPYLHIGDAALEDRDSTGGAVDDAVAAFQWFLGSGGTLDPDETEWHGAVIVYGLSPDVSGLTDALVAWVDGRDAEAILAGERAAWSGWLAAGGVIDAAIDDAGRLALAKQSLVMMRMGQVREENGGYGKPHGQIVASMPPGMWNITWPRDQAYAIAGLAEAGFYEEAKAALEFVFNGEAGGFGSEVGVSDYLVSVCRYHGGGFEESDGDPMADGPNIEFDNFGLFLWSLGKYVEESEDLDIVAAHWEDITAGTADVLTALIEPETGLLKADSSIWERHWNGNEKHFAYSDIMAVRGLCSAAEMAEAAGMTDDAARYTLAAREIHAGIEENLVVESGGFIAQSLEEISAGAYVDASVVEALNFGLFAAGDEAFTGTLGKFASELWMDATGNGYKRNDDGDWYDEQEWIVMDLRIALASRINGDDDHFDELVDWVTAQSQANRGLIAELYTAAEADYEGAVPMMGFGAGAYLIALLAEPDKDSVAWCLEGVIPGPDEGSEPVDEVEDMPESVADDPVEGGEDFPEEVAEPIADASDAASDDLPMDAGGEDSGGGDGCGCMIVL